MTTEELLRPRYKVIADYPNMELDQIGVNDIVSPYGMGFMYPEKVKEKYDRYPHLFKKMEWWEERKPEDMPRYVKWDYKPGIDDNSVKNLVCKVDSYTRGGFAAVIKFETISTSCLLPATESEYNTYTNQATPNNTGGGIETK